MLSILQFTLMRIGVKTITFLIHLFVVCPRLQCFTIILVVHPLLKVANYSKPSEFSHLILVLYIARVSTPSLSSWKFQPGTFQYSIFNSKTRFKKNYWNGCSAESGQRPQTGYSFEKSFWNCQVCHRLTAEMKG